MTIAIVAASGRTSSYVLNAFLSANNSPVCAIVRSELSAESVRKAHPELKDSDVVTVGEYTNAQSLDTALEGARVVWYNPPAFISNSSAGSIAVIEAAMRAGAEHFVFCSVLHPLLTKLINHKDKLPVEEYLIESGMSYTILQPTSFMQNVQLHEAFSGSKFSCIYSTSVLQGFLSLDDLAEIAVKVITDPTQHALARYELVGENVSHDEVAVIISEQLGKSVKPVLVPREQAVEGYAKRKGLASLSEKDDLERMLFYYDKRGIPGNANICRWLLGREPTTWREHVRRELAKLH